MHGKSVICIKRLALMIRYNSQNQIKLEFFKTEFETKLDKNNRWVRLAGELNFDEMAKIYYRGDLPPINMNSVKTIRILLILLQTYSFKFRSVIPAEAGMQL
jgi:hypothetical protein